MKDRLYILLKEKSLTASRFAEILNIQSSSVSHLLSGRNKPSFDLVARVLDKFPEINPDWFILGKEPMYRGGKQSSDGLFQQITEEKSIQSEGIFMVEPELTNPGIKSPQIPAQTLPTSVSEKKIRQIVIFYEDNTCSIYSPEKSV